jgi:aryl-alcohol dehydrogenase-like predicted oxidoreductase
VGARSRAHIDDAIAAADVVLDDATVERILGIVQAAVPVTGPSPESV